MPGLSSIRTALLRLLAEDTLRPQSRSVPFLLLSQERSKDRGEDVVRRVIPATLTKYFAANIGVCCLAPTAARTSKFDDIWGKTMPSQNIAATNTANAATGVAIDHGGKRVLLKWHRLRREMKDPLFSGEVLAAGLKLGASMEIDLRATRDGSFAVLHDRTLDRETNGSGPVSAYTGDDIRGLLYTEPARDGTVRHVLTAEDLAELLGPAQQDALLQFDMKDDFALVGEGALDRLEGLFADRDKHLVVSGDDTELTLAITDRLPAAKRGLEPSFRLMDLHRAGRKSEVGGQLTRELSGPIRPYIVYLNWKLLLDAYADGIDLVRICHDHGARVDAWTFTLADPDGGFSDDEWQKLERLLELGIDQITTDEAVATERAYLLRMGG